MELRDYIAALHRQWRTWVGTTLAGVLAALAVVLVSPHTYEATAHVFVSSTVEGASPQFVGQRVKSYPDVAVSAAVLTPASERLEIETTVRELRAQVSASNPADTSQINIVASTRDPDSAAAIANAVAAEFTGVVEGLEESASGRSPVSLTVTNPATAPAGPASPQTSFVLVLGAVLGIFLGAAAAIVRSRLDTRVHGAADVPASSDDVPVLTGPGRSAGSPAATLARRLEALADAAPVHVAVLSPAPGEQQAAAGLAAEVATELDALGVPAAVSSASAPPAGGAGARVHLAVGDPRAPLREWRSLAAGGGRAVLVLPEGQVETAELQEARTVLRDAGLPVLAVVVTARPGRAAARRGVAEPDGVPAVPAPRPAGSPAPGRVRPAAALRR